MSSLLRLQPALPARGRLEDQYPGCGLYNNITVTACTTTCDPPPPPHHPIHPVLPVVVDVGVVDVGEGGVGVVRPGGGGAGRLVRDCTSTR